MPYWVYGLRPPASADPLGIQSSQPQPAEPVIIEADSEDAARARAQEMGMIVESVEFIQAPPKPVPVAPPAAPFPVGEGLGTAHPVARVLVIVFRVLAGVAALLYLLLCFMTLEAASEAEQMAKKLGRTVEVPSGVALVRLMLEAVLVVSFLLAVAELLRLGMCIERNTRSRAGSGEQRPPRE